MMFFRRKINPQNIIPVRVFFLAWPLMLGMMSQVILNICDAVMVGHLPDGVTALAATGLGSLVFMVVAVTFESLGMGTQILVSRRFGEKNWEQASAVLLNSLVLTGVGGLLITGLAMGGARPFVDLLVRDLQVQIQTTQYVQIRFLSLFFYLVMAAFRGYFDGEGKTRIRMESMILIVVLNIFLNYLLIFGVWGFPRLEVRGAALASTLSVVCGSLYILVCALRDRALRHHHFFAFRHLNVRWMQRIIFFAFPRGVRYFLTFSAFLILFKIVGLVEEDVASLAATNILVQILSFSFMPAVGIGLAGGILIGQSLGSLNPAAARLYGWGATRFGVAFSTLVGLIFILFPTLLLSAFTEQVRVIELARWPLIILGASQFFQGAGAVLSQCLDGAGATHWVMGAEVVIYWAFLIPVAYLGTVVTGWGLVGGWAAFGAMTVIYSLSMALKFSGKSWTRIAA